jgi:hypothetical protein
MTDFVKEYKQKRLVSNLWIVGISLVLALWINFFLLDETEIWQNLKASILDVNTTESKADFYLENAWNSIIVKNSNTLQGPTSVWLTLSYNPEVLEIGEITADFWWISILWEKNTWTDTILLTMNWTRDIYENEVIFKIDFTKKEQVSTQLNMVNANFTDINENQYNLSTSGITF